MLFHCSLEYCSLIGQCFGENPPRFFCGQGCFGVVTESGQFSTAAIKATAAVWFPQEGKRHLLPGIFNFRVANVGRYYSSLLR
jgi:hypothetical protein